jgi:putative spermidine/putrescine transport system substrate-binding protein
MLRNVVATAFLITCSCAASAQAPASITVAWFGGSWGEAFNECIARPFTQETGIKVIPEVGTSTVTLAKLQQEKNAPKIDVAFIDGGVSELAQAAGVADNLDPAAIPNLKNVVPQAIYKDGSDNYAAAVYYFSLGIAYNKDKIKRAPESWSDLWKPEFADAVTIPSVSNSAGVPFVVFLNRLEHGTSGDYKPAFDKLKALKANLLFDSSGAATNAFQSGEVVIGAHFNSSAADLAAKGLPIGFAVPKEGAWASDARLHLVKNSPKKKAAEQFINTALSAPAQACMAEKISVGPVLEKVTVSPKAQPMLPWGENGSVKDLRLVDWGEINRDRAKIVETWNREIARR